MGVQGGEDGGVGRAVTRGAQQRREDGNAGRVVTQEGSNVGRMATDFILLKKKVNLHT